MVLRRWLLPTALLLAVASLTPTASAAGPMTVSGTITMAGAPDPDATVLVEQRLPAGGRGAVFDDTDGYWYAGVAESVDPDSAGRYSLDLDPGTYRLTAFDVTQEDDEFREAEVVVDRAGTHDLDLGVPPDCTVLPIVAGLGRVDDVMSASSAAFGPTASVGSITYQWYRHDLGDPNDASAYTRIEGARSASYTATAADLGRRLEVAVSAIGPFGRVTCDSIDSGVVLPAPTRYPGDNPAHLVAGQTRPSGTAKVGRRLRAPTLQGLPSTTTVTYQWFRRHPGASPIRGATGSSYRLRTTDRHVQIYVIASLSDPAYHFRTVRSDVVRVH